jgi:DoxX-like family
MATTNNTSKKQPIAYWICTGLLSLGMFFGGIAQASHAKWNVEGMMRLGYPLYFMTIIGTWKILGVIALLVPGYQLVKEWAYAGFFILMTGAVVSHLASGEQVTQVIAPSIFVILIVLSWKLRPADRKSGARA